MLLKALVEIDVVQEPRRNRLALLVIVTGSLTACVATEEASDNPGAASTALI